MIDRNLSIADLKERIRARLCERATYREWTGVVSGRESAAVLVPLSVDSQGRPVLVQTKRSELVPQAGDLCSPGGRMTPLVDSIFASLLGFPGAPLHHNRDITGKHRPLIAAALRESWEEVGLNPFTAEILGLLPVQELLLFSRRIYPVCAWAPRQRLRPNREVEKIFEIPLEELIDPLRYGAYEIVKEGEEIARTLCFIYHDHDTEEILWGAALKIVLRFLKLIFEFDPPEIEDLPRKTKLIDASYYRP